MSEVVLFGAPVSPFVEKVRRALELKKVPYRLVEPTSPADFRRWNPQTGKIPVRLGSRFGFAVNPVFEGMVLASALLVEEGVADPIEADYVPGLDHERPGQLRLRVQGEELVAVREQVVGGDLHALGERPQRDRHGDA